MAGGNAVTHIATMGTGCLFGEKIPAKFPILNSSPVELTLVSYLSRVYFAMSFSLSAPLSGALTPLSNSFPALIAALPMLISMASRIYFR
jgi:hypothetical protein